MVVGEIFVSPRLSVNTSRGVWGWGCNFVCFLSILCFAGVFALCMVMPFGGREPRSQAHIMCANCTLWGILLDVASVVCLKVLTYYMRVEQES